MNLLGKGSFGSVFKAVLADDTTVAVKVFNLELEGALKSFDTESRILGSIRHRNLIKILGCCSNEQFKALILAYTPNGSLEKWLHSDVYVLDLVKRLNIAIDVALALEYLHHNHTFTVVHCDIKPNNVLLGEDMTAHVGDFGISKLFEDREAVIHTITMATIGYAAPEYGSEGKVSTHGDVYSFGILLLEIFTSKKPTNDMFRGEMGIKEWVGKALQEDGISEVVAPGLLSRSDRHFPANEQCVSSIFDLAMKCLAFSPEQRINMMQAAAALQKFRAIVEAAKKKQSRS
ncbi:probable LRR receptor-like serine/threonine-protein kinase At3g47570 [Salvia hispanica]|uniref:probable LRR receptor-like serine/threonine-protein kinase At3g47570 n=1 Tax=Salvia hispanica TaxID=49212 RepID=UPI0020096FBC|nr:probable LRR receptor-like serine/threonine-protein kinase At3g47570 [Salvia hispanica]